MAAPATTVPGKSSTSGHAPRASSPTTSSTREASSTRSSPNRRDSGAAGIENTAKHSTGVAASLLGPRDVAGAPGAACGGYGAEPSAQVSHATNVSFSL